MYLPRPIYESIPALYAAAAVATVVLIPSPVAILSAALLAYAAWMVWRIRRDYRNFQAAGSTAGGTEKGDRGCA